MFSDQNCSISYYYIYILLFRFLWFNRLKKKKQIRELMIALLFCLYCCENFLMKINFRIRTYKLPSKSAMIKFKVTSYILDAWRGWGGVVGRVNKLIKYDMGVGWQCKQQNSAWRNLWTVPRDQILAKMFISKYSGALAFFRQKLIMPSKKHIDKLFSNRNRNLLFYAPCFAYETK